MITNPIIPIWLMSIICIALCYFILNDKSFRGKISNKLNNERTNRQKQLIKMFIINSIVKIAIVVFIFVINLRFMIPNGETISMSSDVGILFVVDTSTSMKALDYNGNKERIEGIKNDCCYIIDELAGCKFSLITFGNSARRVIPFTPDSDIAQAEIKSIQLESDTYAKGTSLNIVKNCLEQTLKSGSNSKNKVTEVVVFFISDGEITKEGENLNSFANLKQYVSNGAVLGYGTQEGGKMVNSLYEDKPDSEYYYKYYYDQSHNRVTALSKIDEGNLKKIGGDLGIDYIKMDRKENINSKLKSIKEQVEKANKTEKKVKAYQDIYYYFSIPLAILLIINFIIQKRSI